MAKEYDYHLKKLNKNFTITVNIYQTKEFKIRFWIVKQLFKLAAFILDCNIEVVEGENDEALF